ncbi:MAG: aminotransferase class V-fold PLP-dependent enzyme, partial [Candidatus Micrarchaeota archaeon]|nr:aminotransferase class V-fold PLP-dependent enzyme [Candidatus Micrarchaeota archaeon]
ILAHSRMRFEKEKDTVLVTIMHANNEIGSIQPIAEMVGIAHENGALFHTDAVQSVGKIDTNVKTLGVDMLSLSGHKIHGPKGVAALYVRKGTKIEPIIRGGGHEWNLRSGTENVPGIAGMGKAIEMCEEFRRKGGMENVKKMRDALMKGALAIPDSMLNGGREKRLPNNANFSFEFIEGEGLLLLLDSKGMRVSTGSACSSHSLKPSHVLLAIGRNHEQAHGSVRITLSRYNTMDEVNYVLEELPKAVERLREISPFKKSAEIKDFEKKYATNEDEHEH